MKHYILILPAVFFFISLSAQVEDPDPLRFQSQIAAFDSLDKCHQPHGNVVLFVGSSSIRMWREAEQVFSKYNVLNRGFGGSHFSDVHHYFSELIVRYSPNTIVLYEGDNDIAHGKNPDRVMNGFVTLVNRIESELGDVNIGFISIKPSPKRWDIADKMIEANKLIRDYCSQYDNLTYIDIWPLMLNAQGRPDNYLYIGDGVHMNQCGYKLWEKEMMPYLENTIGY